MFIAKVQGIIACFRRNGHQFDADRPLATQACELMAARPWAGDRGQRVSLSRFCGSIHACRKQTTWWEVQEFERTYLALEADLLTPSAISTKRPLPELKPSDVVGNDTSIAPQRLTFEDRHHAKTENAVVHSTLMLERQANFRLFAAIAVCGSPLIDFYVDTSTRTKSSEDTEAWVKDMVDGGVERHLLELLRDPFQRASLEKAGFLLTMADFASVPVEEVISEDEHAEMFGQFCLRMVGCRARRLL